jgi:hypothetical protein
MTLFRLVWCGVNETWYDDHEVNLYSIKTEEIPFIFILMVFE